MLTLSCLSFENFPSCKSKIFVETSFCACTSNFRNSVLLYFANGFQEVFFREQQLQIKYLVHLVYI